MDNIKDQMDNVSREMETLRKNQKEMLDIKNTRTEIKNGLISRLAKERTNELKYMSVNKTSKTAMQREKKNGTGQNIQELQDSYKRYNIYMMGLSEGKKREKATKKYLK